MKRLLLAVGAACLLAVAGVAAGAVVGSPDISAGVTDDRIQPGTTTGVQVVLTNAGDLESAAATNPQLNGEVTTAKNLRVDVSGSGPVTVTTGEQLLGTMPEGGTTQLPIQVSVPDDAETGVYTLDVEIDYTHTSYISEADGTRDTSSVHRTLSVPIRVEDGARVDVVDVDSNLRAGSTGDVAVTVENGGSVTARDASLSLTSQSGDVAFGQSATATRHLGTWAPGERRTVTFSGSAVPEADAGQYPFQIQASYRMDNGRQRQTSPKRVGVDVAGRQQFSVVRTESDITVGGTGPYTVEVRNAGPVNASNATVTFASQSADVSFGTSASTTRHVGHWGVGETRTFTVEPRIAPGGDAGSYALSATVQYDDTEGDRGAAPTLSLGLDPAGEGAFELRNVTSTLEVADDGQLRGTVHNTGSTAVENVVVAWATESRTVSATETEYAVGSLAEGESAEFSFDVEVSEAARSGPRQFRLQVRHVAEGGSQVASDPLYLRESVAPERSTFDLSTENATVTTGGSATIGVTVTNAGDQRLTDVSAKLFADSPIGTVDDEAYIAALDPGESTTLTFAISAGGGALPKQYPISMDLQYDEPDGDTVVSDSYRLPIQVTESEGGLPIPLIGGAVVLLILVGAGLYLRRR